MLSRTWICPKLSRLASSLVGSLQFWKALLALPFRRDPSALKPFALVSTDPMDYSGDQIFDLENGVEKQIRDVWDKMFADTEALRGPLTDCPIFVTVFRVSGVSLNLKDLPGIAEQGDTSGARKEFLQASTDIARKHISNHRAIIVLVVPATERDFANSSAVTLALECDPKGTRTIGVMTSMDGVHEEDLFQLVMHRIQNDALADVKLPLGWTAVKCRSATERAENILAEAAEAEYFQNYNFGKRVPASNRSLKVVIQRICQIQEPALDSWIPLVLDHVQHRLFLAEDDLAQLQDGETVSLDDFKWKLNSIVQVVSDNITTRIKAEDSDDRFDMHVCARVHELFQKFKEDLRKDADSFFKDDGSNAANASPDAQITAAAASQSANATMGREGYQFIQDSIAEVNGASREEFLSPLADKRIVGRFLHQTLRRHTETLISGVQKVLKNVMTVLWKENMTILPNVCRRLAPQCTQLLMQLVKEAKVPVFAVVEAEENNDYAQTICWEALQVRLGVQAEVDSLWAMNGPISRQLLAQMQVYWPQCHINQIHAVMNNVKAQLPTMVGELAASTNGGDVVPTHSNASSKMDRHRRIALTYCIRVIDRCGDIIPLLVKQHLMLQKMCGIGYEELLRSTTCDFNQKTKLQDAQNLASLLQAAKAALDECLDAPADPDAEGTEAAHWGNH